MVSMLSCVEDSVVFERYMHEMAYLFKQNLLYKQVRKLVLTTDSDRIAPLGRLVRPGFSCYGVAWQ